MERQGNEHIPCLALSVQVSLLPVKLWGSSYTMGQKGGTALGPSPGGLRLICTLCLWVTALSPGPSPITRWDHFSKEGGSCPNQGPGIRL